MVFGPWDLFVSISRGIYLTRALKVKSYNKAPILKEIPTTFPLITL